MKYRYVKQNSDDLPKSGSIKQFNLPGSKFHYSNIYSFKIEHMTLKINPDFSNMLLRDCLQNIKIISLRRIASIVLDIYELKIIKVESSTHRISRFVEQSIGKLVIDFSDFIKEGELIDLSIIYSAGHVKASEGEKIVTPRNGFHFISNNNIDEPNAVYQAWTQGEATEARYWFPCVDSPQMKFTLEIEITTSNEYLAIANGLLESKKEENGKIIWKYSQKIPLAAYLVSVVIGKFTVMESKYNKVPLSYCWPVDTKKNIDPMLTFVETPSMISFLEDYFEIPYPFQKYAQTAVDNFEFGGMENTSCTTITRNVFHDDTIVVDYHNDILLIIHELAHQWFGNLVTCKNWPHIWLNEGFATYCELLYWEKSRGKDEFHFNLIKYADIYFEEAEDEYIRPIVTNLYKHPDDLFDAHSYEKASIIVHMIRRQLGETDFRESVKKYLQTYQQGSAETLDLLKVFEQVAGAELHSFFDQWVFKSGHPEIAVEYGLELEDHYKNSESKVKTLKIKVIQKTDRIENENNRLHYKFPLEFLIRYTDEKGSNNQKQHIIEVDGTDTEAKIEFPAEATFSSISIDPSFKILKKIKSVKVLNESTDFKIKDLVSSQVKNGETVIERIDATRLLRDLYSEETVFALKETLYNDSFYGVSVEAANTLGSFYDKNDFDKSNMAYQALLSIFRDTSVYQRLRPEVKRAIVKNIGNFERPESINLLEELLVSDTGENIFVMSAAATAIGKSAKSSHVPIKTKKKIISQLMDIVETSNTFQSVFATGALEGIREFNEEKDEEIYLQCIQILLESTKESKDYFVISKAVTCLGKFLRSKIHQNSVNVQQVQVKVLDRLKELLKSDRRRIKINACEALSDENAKFLDLPDTHTLGTLQALMEIAKSDIDGFVRRQAEVCANSIKEWISDWSKKPLIIDNGENNKEINRN